MAVFIMRRLLHSIFVLFIVSVIVFAILHLLPGDPVITMLGDEATAEEVEALKQELGLDRPIYIQYLSWVGNVLHLDFGKSIAYSEEVTSLIIDRLPKTILLGVLAFIVSAAIGIPAGVIAAVRRGSFVDSAITVMANLGMATPAFWLAIMSIYFFSLQLGWLPVQGYVSPLDNVALSIHHMILPVIFLSLTTVASLARQTRSAMLEVIRQDYIRTARAKGQKERIVVYKHALRNALIPLITLLGLELGHLVGGSVIIEKVFNIPGMGTLILNSIFSQDYIVVQACVMIIAIMITLTNLLVDIAYGYVDREYDTNNRGGINMAKDISRISAIERPSAIQKVKANNLMKNRVIKELLSRKIVVFGLIILAALFITAIFAPLLAPYDPYKQNLVNALQKPSMDHLLGTDHLGRDVLSRLIYGSRASLAVGFCSVLIASSIGMTLGMIAGYFGGIIDTIIMRTMDAKMAIPSIILALALGSALGGGLGVVIFLLGIAIIPNYTRLMRGQVLSVRNKDYVIAGEISGASDFRNMFVHVLPNCLSPIIVLVTLNLGMAILAEAGLSFLGLGINPPGAAWGAMVNDGYRNLVSHPILSFAPGFCIMIVVLAFNVVGDALRDTLDPRYRGLK